MSDEPIPASESPSNEPLYGAGAPPPKAQAPGLMDQFMGVFTEPTELFQKLRIAPAWVGATILVGVMAMTVTMIWVFKVDIESMLRPVLEQNPKLTSEQIDKAVEIQSRFMPVFAPIGVVVGMAVGTLLPALAFFLLGRKGAEDGAPSYIQALSATAVPNLVLLPQQLVIAIMCLLKPVGSATPDKLSPTSLGFFLQVENPKLGSLLRHVDPFFIGVYVVTYLALRHLLRLKPGFALGGTLLCAAVTLGFRVMGAR